MERPFEAAMPAFLRAFFGAQRGNQSEPVEGLRDLFLGITVAISTTPGRAAPRYRASL